MLTWPIVAEPQLELTAGHAANLLLQEDPDRRKIRLMESNAKYRYLKSWPLTLWDFAAVFLSARGPFLSYDPTYSHSLFHTSAADMACILLNLFSVFRFISPKILKFLDSFRFNKPIYFLGVPVRKTAIFLVRLIRKILWYSSPLIVKSAIR